MKKIKYKYILTFIGIKRPTAERTRTQINFAMEIFYSKNGGIYINIFLV